MKYKEGYREGYKEYIYKEYNIIKILFIINYNK
jgi:hypothetical protein